MKKFLKWFDRLEIGEVESWCQLLILGAITLAVGMIVVVSLQKINCFNKEECYCQTIPQEELSVSRYQNCIYYYSKIK